MQPQFNPAGFSAGLNAAAPIFQQHGGWNLQPQVQLQSLYSALVQWSGYPHWPHDPADSAAWFNDHALQNEEAAASVFLAAQVEEPSQQRRWRTGSGGHSEPKATSSPEPKAKRKGKAPNNSGQNWERQSRSTKISKLLTQVLRHKAEDVGISIRPDGYCRVDEVMKFDWLLQVECKLQDVEEVVRNSDKKRFELANFEGKLHIRAVQGHSMKVVVDDALLKRLLHTDEDLPPHCVHGTYMRHWPSIQQTGLKAGGELGQDFRNHVHFAPFEPGDKRVISGMRGDCEVAIWIDLPRAIEDDVPFFMSKNGVILSPGVNGLVDKKYFLKAVDLKAKPKKDLFLQPERAVEDEQAPPAPPELQPLEL